MKTNLLRAIGMILMLPMLVVAEDTQPKGNYASVKGLKIFPTHTEVYMPP